MTLLAGAHWRREDQRLGAPGISKRKMAAWGQVVATGPGELRAGWAAEGGAWRLRLCRVRLVERRR